MPHSVRRRTAVLRSRYTGESSSAAARGIPRDPHRLGLDECSPAQRSLRVFLALGIFNQGLREATPGQWGISGITSYNIVLSPNFEHLNVICPTPYNAVRYLASTRPVHHLPGLRLVEQIGDTYRLCHLPTGATMSVTAQPSCRPDPEDDLGHGSQRLLRISDPLVEEELGALSDVPAASPTAQMLLAGLMVRLCLRDPAGLWAVGAFTEDPLDRAATRPVWSASRRLWGHGTRWELEWTSYPFPEDLVAALTDPVAGIREARSSKVRQGWDVALGDSLLALRPR
ncbi:hypothetical protein AB0Q95_45800 [Streptomyces sp. NPDC059900]|uniref:hypothetical protein n=1 Tax=Streptomyces sp. NPDC059900 TaxID=3155816 RepID=UPI00341D92D1